MASLIRQPERASKPLVWAREVELDLIRAVTAIREAVRVAGGVLLVSDSRDASLRQGRLPDEVTLGNVTKEDVVGVRRLLGGTRAGCRRRGARCGS